MRNNKISDCALIDLPKIENRSGNITAIENNLNIIIININNSSLRFILINT